MSHPINNTTSINKIASYEVTQTQHTTRDTKKMQESMPITTKVSDSIELSDTARLMSAVKQEIDMIEEQEKKAIFQEDRSAKIALLKQQVNDGTYEVNTLEIAKKIILEESSSNT